MNKSPDSIGSFKLLGNQANTTEELNRQLCNFVCALYGVPEVSDVNEARYCLFKMGNYSDESLPPTKDCLEKHVQRANYQSFIWKRCLIPNILPENPVEHGWQISNNELVVNWMSKKPAPDELLTMVNCGCKTGCSSSRCTCNKSGLLCTDMCKCTNCINLLSDGDSDDDNIF